MDQNHKKLNKSRDPNSSYFLGYFFRIFFWAKIGGRRVKSVSNLELWYHMMRVKPLGWPDLHGFVGLRRGSRGEVDERDELEDTNSHTHA